ncbi:MAG: (deoxy)nucleoside triphosphate pyrophosphohydrolase [Oligoflexales bacterium]|nr:(deoxy)nucleoside triphosphate pyrophosphohydrolase [Oligoflexales bacterium]
MKEKLVTAALIQKAGKFLVGRRAPTEPLAGMWEFPGGKVEKGESLEQCLIREISEELGIEISVRSYFAESDFKYATGRIKLIAFHCDWISGDLNPSVHDEIDWVDPCQPIAKDLLPADIPILEKLSESINKQIQ